MYRSFEQELAIVKRLRSFHRKPAFLKIWFVPVCVMLAFARIMIKMVRFENLTRFLGVRTGLCAWTPVLTARQTDLALQIGRTVRMTAAYMPWRSDCFPQALCARMLLGLYRVPYVAYFGLRRDEASGDMKAHAWVVSGRVAVTGGSAFDKYTIVGIYACAELAENADLWRDK